MSFSRKTIIYAAAPLSLAAVLATTAGATAASASVHQPPRVASGSVAVSGQGYPVQYEQFLALQGFGRNHGVVKYTNWTYAEQGSGVYAPTAGPDALIVNGSYNHTLNGASLHLIALSNDRLAFAGTGYYNNQTGATWTIKGQIIGGDKVKATVVYNGTLSPGYTMVMTGAIASDGSASGTAVSNTSPPQALTWTMPAGSFFSVLSYSARVQSDQIQGRNATFTFTIPNSVPGLAGIKVTDKVHDGGFGPRHDRFAQGGVLEHIVGGPGITVR